MTSKSQQQITVSTIQEQQQNEPMDEAKRAFFISLSLEILYSLLRTILAVALIALICRIEVQSIKELNGYHRMQEVIELWQKQIIISFTTTHTINCPQNYQEYTSDSWPGSLQGCLCSTLQGLFTYDLVFRGKCTEREYDYGCHTIPSHSSILYSFWKPDIHLCVQRLENYNFYTSSSDIINPQDHSPLACASDLLETLNCPVTSISNQTYLSESIQEMGFSFHREDNYPVVSFRVTQYDFCQDYSKTNVFPGRKSNYILLKTVGEECSALDERIEQLDELSEVDFYSNNQRIKDVIQSLPDYPRLSENVNYRLGYNRYPPWSYDCRQNQSFSLREATTFLTLAEMAPQFNTFRIALVVLLSLQFTYICYYWISNYLYLKQKYQQGYLYLKDFQIKKINKRSNIGKSWDQEVMKFIVLQIFGGTILVINVAAYLKASKQQEWCQSAYSCSSTLIGRYLIDYEKHLGGIVVVALTCVFVTVGMIVLDVLFLMWRRWKGDLQEEEEDLTLVGKASNQMDEKEPHRLNVASIEVTEELLLADEGSEGNTIKMKNMLFQIDDIEGSDSSRYSSNSSDGSS